MRREIQLLALHELGTALAGAAAGRAGLDALRAVSTAYRQYARSHPGRYAATLTAPPADDAPLQDAAGRVLSTIEAVLTGYGVEASDAVHAVRALRALLHGFVAIESSGGFALAEDVDESFDRLIDGFDRSLVGIH
jgi:hypothetical protein